MELPFDNLNIGDNSFVGAGSVVVKDVIARVVVTGVPARIQKKREKI